MVGIEQTQSFNLKADLFCILLYHGLIDLKSPIYPFHRKYIFIMAFKLVHCSFKTVSILRNKLMSNSLLNILKHDVRNSLKDNSFHIFRIRFTKGWLLKDVEHECYITPCKMRPFVLP